MKKFILLLILAVLYLPLSAQKVKKDKAVFKEYQPGYYQNYILKGIEEFESKSLPPKTERRFKMDFSGMNLPNDIGLYTTVWCNAPVSQGNTGTCWCFSTTSFFESEIFRTTGQKVKLSEMFTVYWEYVEKARRFVKERGNSAFAEGSEANAVTRLWKIYGVVPADQYPGLQPGQTYHNHEAMFAEMNNYLIAVKSSNAWNEEVVLSTIKSIMNAYMGTPPSRVAAGGKTMTPQEYLKNELKLNPDDYIDVTSLLEKPYFTKVEYKVPDNWWHSADYYNLPLDDYMNVIKTAIAKGYSIGVGGDVSEAGFESFTQVAMVPTFDIPSEYIDEAARQFRFSNGTTTDDHGLHIVGYYVNDGITWFLLKDSGAGSRNVGKESKSFGYYFFHQDYIRLKMMDIIIHKDMMKDYLPKFKL